MAKRFLPGFFFFWLIQSGSVLAQHLGIAQVLELYNAVGDRRGTILKANDFEYQRTSSVANTTCYRYSRMQADVFNEEYEETVTYCATGSLTYVTYSPDHATNLKFQLTRKFDFQDQGPFTSKEGLLKNLYQKRNLMVETSNRKDAKHQDFWTFQFYEDPSVPVKDPPILVRETPKPDKPEQSAKVTLKGNFYALLIGVNDYKDPKITDLTFPIDDAAKLKRVLTDNYTFPDRNISLLNNPTRKAILRAFDDLTFKLRKDDNLLIFFAGHGRQDEKSQQGYWLPADAENDYGYDWLSNSDIRDQLRRFACQHVLVVSDACFSGELVSTTRGGSAQPSKAIQQLYDLRSRRAMTSTGNTVVPDQSVFIRYLVQRMTENTKPYLTASELFVSMREAVINNSSLKQVPMYGYIQQAGDEGGDFIFIHR